MSMPSVQASGAFRARTAAQASPTGHGLGTIQLWVERSRQRSILRQLDEHLLRDIGLSREEALREAAKPFWLP